MQRTLDEYLDELKKNLLTMGSIVEEAISQSIKALKTDNKKLAQQIIANDKTVNEYEINVDKQCIEIFALFQPVAQDLRFVVSALKINNDLERIGDMAVNISERILDSTVMCSLLECVDILRMTKLSKRMLKKSLNSFVNRDPKMAHMVLTMDDEVDDLYAKIIRSLTTLMAKDPKIISGAIDLIFVARDLERISDLSTNISEDVVFMVEGKIIKHHNVD